ncbi:hypothetical protein E3O62_02435 [Cryobacterium sp. TMT2-15-1]|uniref:hypothetical protein n=1 Tax=Cryobacterium sp. TMT2-15-1 TaxID=1259246 RepID=UPI00106A0218|nr:hypothetical protein [Cryobacterium sp. TMT2-15-1]TFC63704.1 hypothetical protein E3O62_02435 [Cryobacterium sp. TMT2-15-1]
MGVTQLDNLPENQLVRTIVDARQTARELKGSNQLVSGANLAFFVSQSASTYDWSGLLDGLAGIPTYGQARFVITLTSPIAVVPLVDVAVVAYYSADGVTWGEYTYRRGLNDQYNGIAPELRRSLEVLPGIENGPGEAKFMLQLFGKQNSRVAFKLQVTGTDEVSITVTRVA